MENPIIGECLICGKPLTKYYPNSNHGLRIGKGCCKSHSIQIAVKEGRIRPPNPKHSTGPNNSNWKGGKKRMKAGYLYVLAPQDHPIRGRKNGKRRYIAEHRLNMEKHLGRYLEDWEKVHHKNGIKDDNRIENLTLVTNRTHMGKVQCPHCHEWFLMR